MSIGSGGGRIGAGAQGCGEVVTQPEAVARAKTEVLGLAAVCAAKGWLPATAGNLSARVAGATDFCVTRSGADKSRLAEADVLWLDAGGVPREDGPHRPSAETLVHRALYAAAGAGAVIHVHTVYNNLAAGLYFGDGAVTFAGHEMLKALDRWEADAAVRVPIVENHAHIPALAAAVQNALAPDVPAVLVRNHGIYVWGDGAAAAQRHLEALEFLFEFDALFRMAAGRRFPPSAGAAPD